MLRTLRNAASLTVATILLSPAALALDILLTNDDGFDADGINIMFDELTAAGHNVTLVAPKTNQSGTSMAFNSQLFTPVEVVEFAPNKWSVEGSPVDSLQAGLDLVFKDNPPDLVVSGSNEGENVGPITSQSGTVGAAQKALQRGIPALAVSTERDRANPGGLIAALTDAARFTVRVIEEIQYDIANRPRYCKRWPHLPVCQLEDGDILLPNRVGLNINHPSVPTAEATGVVLTKISTWSSIDFTIVEIAPGSGFGLPTITFNPVPPTETEQQEDTYLLSEGYITISGLDPDLNPNLIEQYVLHQVLGGLVD
ncbi:MAG: 5'/3'-nucleotidase SurE [Gammaproteobacteria bacterium]